MRITEVGKLFAGSCIVYFVVAACSAYSGDERSSSGGPPPGSGSDAADTTILDPIANALADGHRSGSRLKLRFYEGSDGSRQFIDFYDTELKTPCKVPVRTGDGKERCVPNQSGTPYHAALGCAGSPTLYAVPKSSPQPTVLVIGAINSKPLSAYQAGALVTPPAKIYWGGDDGAGGTGGCAEANSNPATFNYYAIGAPIADATFVEMTIKTE
jgi:hypothetical protein